MIKSFADTRTAALFAGRFVRSVHPELARRARKALQKLDAASALHDLKGGGFLLERLEHDRKGRWSIRVSGQWRICFAWSGGDAHDVEFVDYH